MTVPNAALDDFNAPDHQLRYLASLVKAKVNVVDVAARFGFDYSAAGRLPCPACHEQSTTKQTVGLYENASRWFCFRCSAGGDVVDWLAARLDTPKREAIRTLCSILLIGQSDSSLVAYLKGTLARPAADLAGAGLMLSTLREVRRLRTKHLAAMLGSGPEPASIRDAAHTSAALANADAVARLVAFFQQAAVSVRRGNSRQVLSILSRFGPACSSRDTSPFLVCGDRAVAIAGAVEFIADLFKDDLPGLSSVPEAIAYLRRRRFRAPLLCRYGAGYCRETHTPDGVAQSAIDTLLECGLVYNSFPRPPRFAMSRRLVVPFRNAAGFPVALAGRSFDSDGPKWMNTSDSPIFSKRVFLFGLDVALPLILETGYVVVCEGYSDVMAATAAGLPAVGTAGTSLTAEHVDSLRGLVGRVVLMFDGDAAGRSAAANAALALRGHVPQIAEVVLSEGVDPDELPSETLVGLVAGASPVAVTQTAEEWAAVARRRLS